MNEPVNVPQRSPEGIPPDVTEVEVHKNESEKEERMKREKSEKEKTVDQTEEDDKDEMVEVKKSDYLALVEATNRGYNKLKILSNVPI